MVVNLMTHLDRQRFEVGLLVLGSSEGGVLEQRLKKDGFPVWFMGKRSGFDPRIFFRMRQAVRHFRPQVVHSHLSAHYVFPALIGDCSSKHVATMHGSVETSHKRVLHALTRIAFWCGVIPVAVSRQVAQWVSRSFGVRDCAVIPNGIPIANYACPPTARQNWRAKQGFTDADTLYACVARLEKQKNQAMLLDAFARAFAFESHAHLLLAGDGTERQNLELRVRELGLQDKVHFLGQRSDVPEILSASDVFVLASPNEGNPLSLMEAMAAGLPVVATGVGGVPELVADQRTGLLVKAGDCDGLAAAMLRLFRNAEMRQVLARSAAEHAERAFSAASMANAYMELYERAAAEQVPLAEKQPAPLGIDYSN